MTTLEPRLTHPAVPVFTRHLRRMRPEHSDTFTIRCTYGGLLSVYDHQKVRVERFAYRPLVFTTTEVLPFRTLVKLDDNLLTVGIERPALIILDTGCQYLLESAENGVPILLVLNIPALG